MMVTKGISPAATTEVAGRSFPRGQTKHSRPGREEKSTQAALHAIFYRDSEDNKMSSGAVFLFSASGRKGFHMAEVETPEIAQCLDAPHSVEEQRFFQSDHLYLVCFLICQGHEITGTVREGRRVSFQFHNSPELSGDVAGFMAGAVVPARKFCFELLKLKRTLNTGVQ
jgi:hypothetical protein